MYISIILLYPLTEDKNTAYIHVCLNLVRVRLYYIYYVKIVLYQYMNLNHCTRIVFYFKNYKVCFIKFFGSVVVCVSCGCEMFVSFDHVLYCHETLSYAQLL